MNLKELAETLGLSQTTVSRALNGYPEVSEATRVRVREAAARHQYRPNMRAKGLATGRSMTIGHILPVSSRHEMVNPIFADFIAGAGESYTQAGYDLLLSVVADKDVTRAYREIAARGTVDGVLVHSPRLRDPRIEMLADLRLPFVVHGRSSEVTRPYSWLDVNNRRAFARATSFLLDLGHRRIALLNGAEGFDFSSRRRDGYAEALAARGLRSDAALVAHDEMTEDFGYRTARRMLAQPDAPTAFVVSSVIIAIGVRRAAEDAGLRLGREVSLVSYDDDLSYFRAPDSVPQFTSVRSSVREAGRLAGNMLLKLIADPETGPLHRLLEADLSVGSSTAPAPPT